MNRKSRFVHLLSFVALIASLFSPLITAQAATLEQMALFNESLNQPSVDVQKPEDGEGGDGNGGAGITSTGNTEDPNQGASSAAQSYTCGDGSVVNDVNGDGVADANDCPAPPPPPPPPSFTCDDGTVVNDTNGDGVADANDCPAPPPPPAPASFTCDDGAVVNDTNGDGVADANDCPATEVPEKPASFTCDDGTVVNDVNGDSVADASDCPATEVPEKPASFTCDDGAVVNDVNGDGVADVNDCPAPEYKKQNEAEDAKKIAGVVPQAPQINEAVCAEDGSGFKSTVSAVETKGVTYTVSEPTEAGVVTVTASLQPEFSWDTANIGKDWAPGDNDTYIHNITLEPCEAMMAPMSIKSLPSNATFTAKTVASGGWVESLAANGTNPVCGEVVNFQLVFTPDPNSSYEIWVEFDKKANNGDPYGYVNANWTSLTANTAGTFDSGPTLTNNVDNGSSWRAKASFTTSGTESPITGILTAQIVCQDGAKLNSNVHARKQSSNDTIPAQVLPSSTNEECAIVNGKPKNCETAKLPTLSVLNDATCSNGTDSPSKISITNSTEGGFIVTLVKDVTNNQVATLHGDGGYGTYTFDNTSDITVRVELQLLDGYAYQVQTQDNPWMPGGDIDWRGNGPYVLGGSGAIKYQEITLKYTPCPEPDVSITKTASKTTVGLNDWIHYEVKITKVGSEKVTVKLKDTLPGGVSNFTPVNNSANDCDLDGSTVECDPVELKNNKKSVTYKYKVKVTGESVCGTDLVNNATVFIKTKNNHTKSSQGGHSWEEGPSASATVSVKPCDPELSIKKKLIKPTDGTAEPGDWVEFKVTVTNHGPGTAKNVQFRDIPDATLLGLESVTLPIGCDLQDDFSILCSIEKLEEGKSRVFTFKGTVPNDGSVCGTGINTATLDLETGTKSMSGQSSTPRLTTDTASVDIECEPDVDITKKLAHGYESPFERGDVIKYKVTVENTGYAKLTGLVMTDATDTTYLTDVEVDGADCNVVDGVVTCPVPELKPGAHKTFTITATVDPNLAQELCGTRFSNQASVAPGVIPLTSGDHDDPLTDQSAKVWSKVKKCDPKVSIEKSLIAPSDGIAEPGDTIIFEVVVKNTGNGEATGVYFTDTMDAPLGDLDWTISPEGACDDDNNCGPFTLAAKSDPKPITFTATVPKDGSVCGEFTNKATLTTGSQDDQPTIHTNSGSGQGSDKPKTSDSAKVKINCNPEIKIEKSDQLGKDDTVIPGQEFTYKITVSNTGNTELSGYVMTDTLPLDLVDFVEFGADTTSCDGPSDTGVVTCDVRTLAPKSGTTVDSQTFYITVKVKTALEPWMCSSIVNTASVAIGESEEVQLYGHFGGTNGNVSDNTSETTKFKKNACKPNIDISKTDNLQGGSVEPGGTYTYTITVTNNGTIDAVGYVMTDTIADYLTFETPAGCAPDGRTIECNVPNLKPGESWSVDIKVTVTADPSSAVCRFGAKNTAEVSVELQPVPQGDFEVATYGGGTYDNDTIYTKVNCDPSIKITKTTDSATAEPGDTIEYTITVVNDGNIPLRDVTLVDGHIALPIGGWSYTSAPAGVTCGFGALSFNCVAESLGVGEEIDITLTGTITTAPNFFNCLLGFTNIVIVGAYSSDGPVGDSDAAPTKLDCDPSISLTKTAIEDTVEPGGTMAFEIVFTNTGNIDVTSATITDPLPALPDGREWEVTTVGDSESVASFPYKVTNLKPGKSVTLIARAAVPGELELTENGNEWCKLWENTAKVTGKYSTSKSFKDSSADDIQVNCTGVNIVKDGPASGEPGGEITYTITVSNMGNTTVNMVVTDELDSRLSNISATLASPAAEIVCDVTGSEVTCPVNNLAKGQVATITITADVIANPTTEQCEELIMNSASIAPATILLRQSSSITIPQEYPLVSGEVETKINCQPDLDLEKSGSVSEDGEISFTITATNTGTGTAENLSIVDTLPAGLVGLDWEISLNPDDTETTCANDEGVITCEPVFLDQYDGKLEITLTAATDAQNPVCGDYTNDVTMGELEADAMVSIDCVPNYEVEKTSANTDDADEDGDLSVGDTLTYTITVTNTGNQDLSGITLDDQFTGGGEGGLTWTEPAGFDGENVPDVAVGSSIDLVATYVITQADVDAGEIENCAFMTYQVDEETVIERDDCADDPIEQDPMYTVEKTSANTDDADEDGDLSVGDTLTYTITVTNTGNLTLKGITLDDQFTGAGEGGLTWTAPTDFDGVNVPDVAVGGSIDLVATYVITQADVDAGEIENCAFMTYQVDEETVIERDDCVDDPIGQAPVYTVAKTSALGTDADEDGDLSVGDTLTYTITVTNTGDVTLRGITLDDQFTGAGEGGLTWTAPTGFDGENVPDVAVGSSIDLVATYVITQADVDAGEIENCAFMTYQVDEETVIERDDCVDDPIEQDPGVELEKTSTVSGDADALAVNNTIVYTFTVTNTGNVTLVNLNVVDDMEGVVFTDGATTIASLAPGESAELTAEYVVTQADVDSGMILNCADVAGMAADGETVMDKDCDNRFADQTRDLDAIVLHECPAPAEELLAEGNFEVTYELTIVNNGTVTVTDVVITTSHEGVFSAPFPTTFEPGQSETRMWTITASEEEIESRVIEVEVEVVGKTPNGMSAMMASMAVMQAVDEEVESRLVLTCPLDVPEQHKPAPDKDKAGVAALPNTGSGSVTSVATTLWAAAMLGVVALGATAVGVRRR